MTTTSRLGVCALAGALLLPGSVRAQTAFGIAGKAGTVGIGVEAALALQPSVVIRGGGALMPVEFDATLDNIDFTVELPETFAHVGIDLYPGGGSFRLGGGLLFKPDDPVITGTCTGSKDFGGTQYDCADIGEISSTVISNDLAPYALIGFGNHTRAGLGFFLDLGVAFLGSPDLELTANGSIGNDPEFRQNLQEQEDEIQADLDSYLKVYPIVQVGLKIGIGG